MGYRERCYGAFVSKHWKYYSNLSEDSYQFLSKVYVKRFGPFLPAEKKAEIIDIACGTGYFLYYLKENGYTRAHGIDISKEQLEVGRKMGLENMEEADLFDYLPKRPGKYDMIVAFDIIEHLRKDEVLEFLDTAYSSLKPGGRILIGTVNASALFGSKVVFIDFTHETGFTPESLSQVLRVCYFEDVNVYGEKPVMHDLRSSIRAGLWYLIRGLIKAYTKVESGTGRNLPSRELILDPRMFAVGRKPA